MISCAKAENPAGTWVVILKKIARFKICLSKCTAHQYYSWYHSYIILTMASLLAKTKGWNVQQDINK